MPEGVFMRWHSIQYKPQNDEIIAESTDPGAQNQLLGSLIQNWD